MGASSVTGNTTQHSFVPLFELARGGMGRVLLAVAYAPGFSRLYAVKRLHPHLAEDAAVRAMFLEEARLAGLVRHPNVVSVLDVGEDAGGAFLVMELVEGLPASRLVERSGAEEKVLSVQMCARIVAQAARGLHAAHELRAADGTPLGLIHRDVSPQNILVGFDGLARVTDFGVAKALDTSALTQTGMLKGKLGYMAPERLRFEEFDRRADLFGLGVVLYELLGGVRLYDGGDGAEVARRILREPPPDVGLVRDDVPPEIVELVLELLAKDPALRPRDAQEVATRLDVAATALSAEEGVLDVGEALGRWFAAEKEELAQRIAEAIRAAAEGRQAEEARRSRRRTLRSGAAAAGALLVGGGGAGVWYRARQAEVQRYPIGTEWRRERDWHQGAGGAPPPNPSPDGRGNPVWQYEATRGGGGLGSGRPWYQQPTRALLWDPMFFKNGGAWARADNLGPSASGRYMTQGLYRADERLHAPVVRWLNPTGREIAVDVLGSGRVIWGDGSRADVELAILRRRAAGGVPELLFSHVARHEERTPTIPVRLTGIDLGGEDALLFTLWSGGTVGYVGMVDDLRVVLVDRFRAR